LLLEGEMVLVMVMLWLGLPVGQALGVELRHRVVLAHTVGVMVVDRHLVGDTVRVREVDTLTVLLRVREGEGVVLWELLVVEQVLREEVREAVTLRVGEVEREGEAVAEGQPVEEMVEVRHSVGVMDRVLVLEPVRLRERVTVGLGEEEGHLLPLGDTLVLLLWLRVTDPERDTLLQRLLDRVLDTVVVPEVERQRVGVMVRERVGLPVKDGVRVEERVEVAHALVLWVPEMLGEPESEKEGEPVTDTEEDRHRVLVIDSDEEEDTVRVGERVTDGEKEVLGHMLSVDVTLMLVLWLRVTDPVRDTLLHRLLDSVADTVTLEVDERH
jgi:hypothetical protein